MFGIYVPQEVRSAIEPIIVRVEEMLRFALEQTPPELVKDIVDQGLILTSSASRLEHSFFQMR